MKLNKRFLLLMFVLFISSMLISACSNDSDSKDGESDAKGTEEASSEDRVATIQADTINSHEVEDAVCVVNSRFEQGWRMVFRATVNDAATNELIEDADVKVVLEDGQEFDMELGNHGEDTQLYTIAWTIPEDYATGTLEYEIIATVDGKEYKYEPFDVEPSKFTVIEATEG